MGDTRIDETVTIVQRRREQLSRQQFNTAQSSQLFINCCFALSLSGVIVIVSEAFKTSPAKLFWIPLSIYLIFSIWRQYSIYYIPLQYYRGKAESDMEEFVTLLITLMLATFCLVCVYLPHWSLVALFSVIVLNLYKIKQMRKALKAAPNKADLADKELATFTFKLWIYLFLTFVMILLVWIYHSEEPGIEYYLFAAIGPLPLQFVVRLIFRDFSGDHTVAQEADKYIASIAAAWHLTAEEAGQQGT
jgi:hypothetical protein